MNKKQKQEPNSFFEVKSSRLGIWGMYLTSWVLIVISIVIFVVGNLGTHYINPDYQWLAVLGIFPACIGFALLVAASLIGSIIFEGKKRIVAMVTLGIILALVVYRVYFVKPH